MFVKGGPDYYPLIMATFIRFKEGTRYHLILYNKCCLKKNKPIVLWNAQLESNGGRKAMCDLVAPPCLQV